MQLQLTTMINGVECFLTGSRHFGNTNPGSDTDLYCQFSEEHLRKLEKEGFIQIPKSSFTGAYRDSNTVVLMTLKDCHIQMQVNLQFKHLAQRVISENFPNGELRSKSDRAAVWNCIYDTIRGVPGLHLRKYTPGMEDEILPDAIGQTH